LQDISRGAGMDAELTERLRLLRRRRLSRQVRSAATTAAWVAISLMGVAFVVAAILTFSA